MDRKNKKVPKKFIKKQPDVLIQVDVDFANNTCTHTRGRYKIRCDCVHGELGRLSEQLQTLQRKGLAKVRYGIMDFEFLNF